MELTVSSYLELLLHGQHSWQVFIVVLHLNGGNFQVLFTYVLEEVRRHLCVNDRIALPRFDLFNRLFIFS